MSVDPRHRRSDLILTPAALVFLAVYAWPILDPTLDPAWQRVCTWTNWAIWALFLGEYLSRLATAENRPSFVRAHLFDLAIIALPVLRPLRLLSLLIVVRGLNRGVAATLRGNVAVYGAGTCLIVLFSASLAVLDAERGAPGANITTFGDALWWAAVTVATVGYGDYYPVTLQGRLVATGLFIVGIGLLGVLTGGLASWFVEKIRDAEGS